MLRFGQVLFTTPHLLLCLFALIDIREQDIPTDNPIVGITLRTSAYVEPAVHAIGSTVPSFNIKRLPGFDRAPIRVDHTRTIIGMVGVADGPIL
jgi:hypothetical protein